MLLVWLAIAVAVGVAIWYFTKKKGDSAPVAVQPAPPIPPGGSPWRFLYSPGMGVNLQLGEGGHYFDFPSQATGSVHYVVNGDTGQRNGFYMRFKLIGDGQLFPTDSDPPARVRPFLQRRWDNLSGVGDHDELLEDGEFEHHRFWGPDTSLNAEGEFVISVPLDHTMWTSVYGQHSETGFAACIADLENVGFTFGGMFAGHGVYTTGQARFVLLEFGM